MAVLATLDRTEDAETSLGAPVVPRIGGCSTGKLSYAEFERQAVEFARAAALASQVRAGAVDSRCSAGAAAPGQPCWPGVANKGISPWRLLATRARLSPSDAVFSPLSSRGGSRGIGSGPRLGMSASPQAEEAISVSSTCNGARAPPPVTPQRQVPRPWPIWRSLKWRSRTQPRCRPTGRTMRCTSMNTTWSKFATPRANTHAHACASRGFSSMRAPNTCDARQSVLRACREIEILRLLIFCDRCTARHTACPCCTCEVARQAGQCWRPRRFGKTCVLPTVGLRPISKPPTG